MAVPPPRGSDVLPLAARVAGKSVTNITDMFVMLNGRSQDIRVRL